MSTPRTPARKDAISDLRAAIATAIGEGAKPKKLLLQLTHRDASLLKRSPSVAQDEISFADGEMWFLGVKAVVGTVTVSGLVTP